MKMKFHPSFLIAFIFLSPFSNAANAQLIGNDVFLKGRFLEIGVNQSGAYGTNSNAPSGYHPYCPPPAVTGRLGFVADPDMDGWTTGTPPYFGDYFMLGSILEGWCFQLDNLTTTAISAGTISGSIPVAGANISYNLIGGTATTTWQGIYNSLKIEQVTTLDTSSLYFTVKITFTNMSTTPRDSFYYLRVVEPDNDPLLPLGSFNTDNYIEHQRRPSDSGLSVVSATAAAHPNAYLALGTKDPRAKAFINHLWGATAYSHLDSAYAELLPANRYRFTPDTLVPGDFAIGLIFYVGNIDPGQTKSISYIYSFKRGLIDSVAKYTDTLGVNSIANTANSKLIKAYPNPFAGTFNVSGIDYNDETSVYSIVGKEINLSSTYDGHDTRTFSLTDIPCGSYFLIVRDNIGNIKFRTVLQKM